LFHVLQGSLCDGPNSDATKAARTSAKFFRTSRLFACGDPYAAARDRPSAGRSTMCDLGPDIPNVSALLVCHWRAAQRGAMDVVERRRSKEKEGHDPKLLLCRSKNNP